MAEAKPEEGNAPVEEVAVTGRPADVAPANTTFADRAKAARKGGKAVEDAENKSVSSKKSSSK